MSGDIHALSGAYAVDAVDDLERMQFERHLADCPTCRAEVASLREAAAQLPEVSYSAPSAALRSQVLAGIATVRPLPPVVVRAEDARRSSKRRFPALVAAAAALIVIGGAGATAWHPWQSDQTSIQASEAERVLQAADRQSVSADLPGDASATLTRSASLNLAVVQTKNLPSPPSGMVYEMWLRHGTEPMTRAGLIPEGGDRTWVLSGDPASADYAGITVEPAGGSDAPSSTPIANFSFEHA